MFRGRKWPVRDVQKRQLCSRTRTSDRFDTKIEWNEQNRRSFTPGVALLRRLKYEEGSSSGCIHTAAGSAFRGPWAKILISGTALPRSAKQTRGGVGPRWATRETRVSRSCATKPQIFGPGCGDPPGCCQPLNLLAFMRTYVCCTEYSWRCVMGRSMH